MSVGILAMTTAFPSSTRSVADVCAEEGIELSAGDAERLGIDTVRACDRESGADLALRATTEALEMAGVTGKQVDVILDWTVLPQHFLVPVWNLGNKLQHELGATNAFTLGFSGGGATNLHVALRFASDLIRSDPGVRTALLFGADSAIPGNRVLGDDSPVTVLGDGASALVLGAEATTNVVLATELVSDGAYHDVCHIPGGALAHLDHEEDAELYRLRIDSAKLADAPTAATLKDLGDRALSRAGVALGDVGEVLLPNISAADDAACRAVWDARPSPASDANRRTHGHVQGNDLVLNLSTSEARPGDVTLVASHGMGFTAGVSVIRR
jgi:3-oxoacyl-[acyl-carrier-protein] synthase III